MPSTARQPPGETEARRIDLLAWFLELLQAKEQNRFDRAVTALEELKRLGVDVKFTKPREQA